MNGVVPYLLTTPAGWLITFIAIVTIIGLLIGILKVNVKILQHLKGPKLIWDKFEKCKYCNHLNDLDPEEMCSERFTCVVCRKDNTKNGVD